MEKAAKTTLRQLKEACLTTLDPGNERRDEYFDDITTMVTLSIMALQSQNTIKTDRVHSVNVPGTSHEPIRALLEAAALEGLQELITKEIRTTDTQQTSPYTVAGFEADDFWSHCLSLSHFSSIALINSTQSSQIVSSLCRVSLGCSRLLTAFLSVGKAVLNEQQMLSFLSHLHSTFWSQETKSLTEEITLIKANECVESSTAEGGNSIAMLARIMATLYCLFSVHRAVNASLVTDQNNLDPDREGGRKKSLSIQQNRAIDQWLCRSVTDPLLDLLTATAPKLLLAAYQHALERDKVASYKRAELGEMPHPEHLMVVDLLVSSFHCLSKLSQEAVARNCSLSPSISKDKRSPLLGSVTTETVLRLTNHCWEQLSEQAKKVPSELPANTLCLILASFVKLHSYLSHCNLPFNDEQKEAYSFLLHSLSESCEGAREQLVSYHIQLCLTSLLHDASSQDWTNTKPFFEGERGSYTVQMWRYHMQGLRYDLCTFLAPTSYELAEKVLLGVLSGSLAHLARRYSASTPSHARLNQFRADILSIFSTVLSLQPQLLRHQTSGDHGRCNSPEITLIHRSCNQLLDVLTIGASPLADLEEALNQHSPPSPVRGRDNKYEATGDAVDKKRKENVFHESAIIKGSSGSRWVRILERHQMAELLMMSSPHTTKGRVSTEFKAAEGEEGTTSIYGQNFGATALGSWFSYNITMLKSGSSTGGVDDKGGVHGGLLAASRLINTWISLTQPNIAPSLLQALLLNNASLMVALSLSSRNSSLIVDIASLLSLCCHGDEWALSNLYRKLRSFPEQSRDQGRGNSSEIQDRNTIKIREEALCDWLSQQLQIELESYVLSMAARLQGNLHDEAKIWQHLDSSLVQLGERLSKMELPDSIINLIWTMAEDVSKRDSCSDGVSLARVVGFLVSRWPIFAHLRLPEGPLGATDEPDSDSAYCIRPVEDSTHNHQHLPCRRRCSSFPIPDESLGESVSAHLYSILCSLFSGLKLPLESQGMPRSVQAAIDSHQMELQSFLNQFDRFLPRAETSGGRDRTREEPTLAEYEAMWEVIADDDVMVMSLERIHSALVGCCSPAGHGFNPQGEYNNVPTMEIVDNIDWKGLVGGVLVGGIATPTVCRMLEKVRWEFQDGASGYLEERETELVKAVRTHLY